MHPIGEEVFNSLYDLACPAVDPAELHYIGVALLRQLLRCLLAAVAAAAVHQNQLVLVRQFGNFLTANGFIGNADCTGNMPRRVFFLRAYIQQDKAGFLLHQLGGLIGSNLPVG